MPMDRGEAEFRQMYRQHIFIVNSDPAFLDLVRVLLQDERYNVTTTNFVPRTFNQIVALRPALLIIDLAIMEQAGWNLLERLKTEALTTNIPVIVVSTNQRLLDHVQQDPDLYAGNRYVALPFDLDQLLAAVHALIGTADTLEASVSDADDDEGGWSTASTSFPARE